MFESKNLLDNAIKWAIYDRLCSAVYYALNYTLGYSGYIDEPENPEQPDKLLEEWRELGAYTVGCTVVLSSLPEGPSLPHAGPLIPWIEQYLRPHTEEDILPIVQKWLDGEPLEERVCRNPQDEDMKVRELKKLLSAIHAASEPTAGKSVT